jgi:hypothetical protein
LFFIKSGNLLSTPMSFDILSPFEGLDRPISLNKKNQNSKSGISYQYVAVPDDGCPYNASKHASKWSDLATCRSILIMRYDRVREEIHKCSTWNISPVCNQSYGIEVASVRSGLARQDDRETFHVEHYLSFPGHRIFPCVIAPGTWRPGEAIWCSS